MIRPRIHQGTARTSDGVEHRLHIARPNREVAARIGLNRNHHVRLWCECQSQQRSAPGELPNGLYWREDRTEDQHRDDPRRLGGWDFFAVADVRESGSATRLFLQHLEDHEARHGDNEEVAR